jgi:hypothetical protein
MLWLKKFFFRQKVGEKIGGFGSEQS